MILFIGGKKPPVQRLVPRQFRMAMKLTVALLTIAFHVSAGGYSQNVTLSLSNAPLEKAFAEIKKQTGINFIYTSEMIKDAKTVSITVKNESLDKVLALCFKDQPFGYSFEGKYIVVKPKSKINYTSNEVTGAALLPIDITGRVVNEQGQPVEGVTVTIKGSGESTNTNANGEFSLSSVEQDAVLVFTHISMESFELKVSGKKELIVRLKTKISELSGVEVVSTGY